MTTYLLPVNLKEDDVVWVRLRTGYIEREHQARPSVVRKVYPDGNILHKQHNQDEMEFAFAKAIYAKSLEPFTPIMRYRMVDVTEIQKTITQEISNVN